MATDDFDLLHYMGMAVDLALGYNLDPMRVLRLIQQESQWVPTALNQDTGCKGLLQLNPKFFSGDLYDPVHNLHAGLAALARHVNLSGGDWREALARWNWGEGNVLKARKKWPGKTWLYHLPRQTLYLINLVLYDGPDNY